MRRGDEKCPVLLVFLPSHGSLSTWATPSSNLGPVFLSLDVHAHDPRWIPSWQNHFMVCRYEHDKLCISWFYQGSPGGSDGKEFTCNAGDLCLIPGLGRSPGGGNGNPLQYFCLNNPVDRGAWWAAVHGVTKSQTQLGNSAYTHTHQAIVSVWTIHFASSLFFQTLSTTPLSLGHPWERPSTGLCCRLEWNRAGGGVEGD